MTQELEIDQEGKVIATQEKPTFRKKRDIFHFIGEKDIAINLEHVTCMHIEGKRITFQFYSTASYVDFEDEEAGKRAYEQILGIWSAYVLE